MSANRQSTHQLEEHSLQFALAVREFGKSLPMTVSNVEDLKQLIRASGAIGARFISAKESTSKSEYISRIKACGLEAQSTYYWLRLVDTQSVPELDIQRNQLLHAAKELMAIFYKIIESTTIK
ncbi:four helix bundle protein [Pontibacter sp. G13]|uniref:four helix bundle protein n=1 Tax=Pontibacter sp. G13 TaxID=3074898 RepID=UPI00288BE530|nr:four helix bundle protein [Pontibacter sp. G13]WNJ19904.1 four helix bundle protein [Pontibacter sp. G13]